jgi:hypothetical protein
MGFEEELAHLREIVCAGAFHEVEYALVFRDYVPGSRVRPGLFEVRVSQRGDSDLTAGFLAFGYTRSVGRLAQ